MTTTATSAFTSAVANGINPIPFTFQAISASEVGVQRAGVEQINGTHFTVTLNGDGTGSVTPTSTWGTDAVVVYSNPNYTQPVDFSRFGAFYPDQIVPPIDRLSRALIAFKNRALLLPVAAAASAASRVGKFIGFNAAGDPILTDGTGADNILRTDLAAAGGVALVNGAVRFLSTRTALAAITSPAAFQMASVSESGREGVFVFSTANLSAQVTSDPAQGLYVAPASASTGASGAWVRKYTGLANVAWFMDGTSDLGLGFTRAFNAGLKTIEIRYENSGTQTTKVTPPGGAKITSRDRAVITKGANIDMFDATGQTIVFENLSIDANGANFTGRGVVINAGANSYDQKMRDVDILHSNGPAVEFTGADAGQRFSAEGCNFSRSDLSQAGVVGPSVVDVTAGNRKFTDCGTIDGCPLIELKGMANTGIVNCEGVNIIFSSLTSRTRVTGDRIAALGGTMTIDGNDNYVGGNVLAGSIVLAATSQRCMVAPMLPLAGATITDNSTATGSNMNVVYDVNGVPFTPVLGQLSGTGPSLGNGSASGRIYRSGRLQKISGAVAFNTTSTFGDGGNDWTISIPTPNNRTAAFEGFGVAVATIAGVRYVGAAHIAQGDNKITIFNNNGGTGWKSGAPAAWTTSSTFSFEIEYELG